MMKSLVIAEKPSVAKSIANVLGANKRGDGYLEGDNYLVSWCFGHLAELASAEVYDEKYAKWSYADLPIVPEPWRYSVGRDKKKQLDLLSSLMKRSNVGEIVNACDAGREGELIFRTVYNLSGCTKPMKRLWISSMEDNAIREGFDSLRPGENYDSLYASALCRSKADWMVGINATRLFSVLYHRTLNVGRVISPTLSLIVGREAEIDAFKPELFYTVELDCGGFKAASEKFRDKSEADGVADDCKNGSITVKSIERKEKTEKAPLLYDLTTLQRDANRQLGYTAQQTLDYLQSLYEKKLSTYPRTDSRFLTDDMESTVNAVVLLCSGICGGDAPVTINTAQVCDSKKVSDHHAIIPTMSAGETDLSALLAGEREILRLVAKQVLRAVSAPYRYSETTVTMDCDGRSFTVKGRTVIETGWKAFAEQEQKDKPLPELSEGQVLTASGMNVKEGKTSPPKHFTEDTILAAMETAGANDMPEDAERKGLGTPATRAAILEKLVSTGFVERQKNKKTVNLIPAHSGISLITVLPEQLQSPLLTAEWENKLKQIEHGKLSPEAFMRDISDMVAELVKTYEVIRGAEVLFPSGRAVVGKCPRCGSDVTESKKGYFCENNDCRFGLWRDNKFLTAKRVTLSKKMVTSLLKDGRTFASGIYSEKTGKSYDAYIMLEDDGSRTSYKLDFSGEAR
ncbi:MAG: DNA topoisomerase 3 [Synergistaceae bacterium]|jgi:DNA topoisomerase-3|nr:DNA topoisomerase 3 [Synergistaceae bacterium]